MKFSMMTTPGLAMWFSALVSKLFPNASPTLVDAFKEAHAHEALLAFLAIVIWHFYNVHWRPGRFPGSLQFLHGRMSMEEMVREHPCELMAPGTPGHSHDGKKELLMPDADG